MSAYQQLRDISINFENQLQHVSTKLFSVISGESYENGLSKKLQDLTFLTSKLRLLRAKQLASTPQLTQEPKTDSIITAYGELAQWKVLEQCIVKSLTQAHAVKSLVTSPDGTLDPELVERKEKIIETLKEYRLQETQYRQLDAVCEEKEMELEAVRDLWDSELTALREMREESQGKEECEDSGPLYRKLRTIVDKLELMRWLLCRLVVARGGRDWLADPERTGRVLKLTRARHTVQNFID